MLSKTLSQLKTPRDVFAFFVATAGGAGLFPIAPGTAGSVVGLALSVALQDLETPLRLAIWITITLLGIWSAKVMDEIFKSSDNQKIVIDEVVGMAITAWATPAQPIPLIVAFLLFRLFDILKIWPVRWVDVWSKKKAKEAGEKRNALLSWAGGFGVVADDLIAGFQGWVIMSVLIRHNILPF